MSWPFPTVRRSSQIADNSSTRLRVLIVDDLIDDTDVLSKLLSKLGCDAAACKSGQQTLVVARRVRPHLILLDVAIPGMDGFDVARALQTSDLPPFLLVARTGYADDASVKQCLTAGFDSVLVKPEEKGQVLELLDFARQRFLCNSEHTLR